VLRGLNPREIASIDVLKDVASTAAYGIKGAHGVIIITMKHER
jgi:TonB-dependent SusC/RagA subfamily outer membrane receptor